MNESEEYKKFYAALQKKLYKAENEYKGPAETTQHVCYRTECEDTTRCELSLWYGCKMNVAWQVTFVEAADSVIERGILVMDKGPLADIPVRDILNDMVHSTLDAYGREVVQAALDEKLPYATYLALFYYVVLRKQRLNGLEELDRLNLAHGLHLEHPFAVKAPMMRDLSNGRKPSNTRAWIGFAGVYVNRMLDLIMDKYVF